MIRNGAVIIVPIVAPATGMKPTSKPIITPKIPNKIPATKKIEATRDQLPRTNSALLDMAARVLVPPLKRFEG